MQNNNKQFKQLNQEQRVEIYALLQAWLYYRKIAKEIWVSHTTISREIKRNSIEYRRWRKSLNYRTLYEVYHWINLILTK